MMDVYQGYHQIFMAEEDRDKTSVVTENGVYCYNVMPFGLKNASATYQRLVNKMFKDLIGSIMEVYVDDMLVKSKIEEEHLRHLENSFTIMRTWNEVKSHEVHIWGSRRKILRLHGQRARDRS
ncbi:UNVERIFIED_CONTAM: Retrovirus-related Pol polyprotein from transposon gypsy [Sesamum latifolium]|uniref:Retrovirus-related Pol polyprotein from transposon gypsy n=1 Tax=Sesamum latifolium TaxID=2727402 RepID=A0AAW2UHW6_9LAMI